MSDSAWKPWSNNPNAPQIPHSLYVEEKANFAGELIGSVFYGIVIVLFFRCMTALLGSASRRRGDIKWLLVIHTVAMFLFVTVYTAITLNTLSVSYVDNREFPGVIGALPPGPLGYQFLVFTKTASIIATATFVLNNWLADGLLIYRCYVIYSMNHWVIAFPGLMYLASLATGTTYIYHVSRPLSITSIATAINKFGVPHHSISVSLNVLLTLMIATRLMLHRRDIRKAMGTSAAATSVYGIIIAILVESCAFYAATFLLFIGPWAATSPAAFLFFPILVQAQVIAPFLVILRVANHNELAKKTTTSGTTTSIRFGSQENQANSNTTLPGGYTRSFVDRYGKIADERGAGVEIAIGLHPDS